MKKSQVSTSQPCLIDLDEAFPHLVKPNRVSDEAFQLRKLRLMKHKYEDVDIPVWTEVGGVPGSVPSVGDVNMPSPAARDSWLEADKESGEERGKRRGGRKGGRKGGKEEGKGGRKEKGEREGGRMGGRGIYIEGGEKEEGREGGKEGGREGREGKKGRRERVDGSNEGWSNEGWKKDGGDGGM